MLATMAYEPLSPETRTLINTFLGTSTALLLAAFSFLLGRISSRAFRLINLHLDDWILIAGFLSACVSWSVQVATVVPWLRSDATNPGLDGQRWIIRMTAISLPFWTYAVSLVKISVLVTLLGLRSGRCWQAFLRTMIALQLIFFLGDSIMQLANMNLAQSAQCVLGQSPRCIQIITYGAYVEALFTISTDIIISLIPITFVSQLRRPNWEKALICGLMALGILVSAACVRKTLVVAEFQIPPPADFKIVDWVTANNTWTCVEMFFGVIAACLPRLKSMFERALRRVLLDFPIVLGSAQYENADDLPDFCMKTVDSLKTFESKSSMTDQLLAQPRPVLGRGVSLV